MFIRQRCQYSDSNESESEDEDSRMPEKEPETNERYL